MRIWRIVSKDHLDHAWLAPRGDHRWTTRQSLVTYASLEPGLAVAEKLAYVRSVDQLTRFLLVAGDYDGSHESLEDPPSGWDAWPHDPKVQHIGDAWAARKDTGGLIVPSVLLPGRNILLDQEHPDFHVEPEETWDLALFSR